jgi:hypothetical protein
MGGSLEVETLWLHRAGGLVKSDIEVQSTAAGLDVSQVRRRHPGAGVPDDGFVI